MTHDPATGLDLAGLASAAKLALSGAVGAFGLWLANRVLGKAAFQQAINAGFAGLTAALQLERTALRRELSDERIRSASERAQLRGEILNLTQTIISLENLLREHGVDIPVRYYEGAAIQALELPASKGDSE